MEHIFYQKEMETISPAELRELQSERLIKQVRHVYDHLPYYRKKMEEKGVTPEDIKSIDDLHLLPFLEKSDLRETYPDGMLAVPKAKVCYIHATSGTTGKRVIAYYTQHDLDLWEDCVARAFVAAGISKEDIIQIAFGYGMFTGGAGMDGGSRKLGCMTIPMSSGNSDRQLQFMRDLGTTVVCCTPSYAAYLGENMQEFGFKKEDLTLRVGIFGAEPWTEEMRKDIENTFGIKAYDIYGLTEISGPGVAFECGEQHGMHINEDHFVAEIIDPNTGEVLPKGSKGELVFTCLDKEAFPMLRYRTHDICQLDYTPCSCGRTFVRMKKPMGRSDDMMIIRGVNVFPSQIEAVLMQKGYSSNYQIVVDREKNSDSFDVYVEMQPEEFDDTVKAVAKREKELQDALVYMVGVKPKVHLVSPKSIARSEGKAVRVIDRRKLI